jgi:hypothetical protein
MPWTRDSLRRPRRFLVALNGALLLIGAAACSNAGAPTIDSAVGSQTTNTPPGSPQFVLHGQFCGRGWPVISGATTIERQAALEEIQADDDLDAACKEHDLCYERIGMDNIVCDRLLIEGINALALYGKCRTKAISIKSYFGSVHPDTSDQVDYSLRLLFVAPFAAFVEALGVVGGLTTAPLADKTGKCNYNPELRDMALRQASSNHETRSTHENDPVYHRRAAEYYWKIKQYDQCDQKRYLGQLYWDGNGLPQNYRWAGYWFNEAYKCGEWIGAMYISSMYIYGLSVQKDYGMALQWLKNCAEKYESESCRIRAELLNYKIKYDIFAKTDEVFGAIVRTQPSNGG